MIFADVAVILQEIESVSSRLTITEKLAQLWRLLTPVECAYIAYILQGRVRPEYEGVEFALAEKQLIKGIAIAFGVAVEHVRHHAQVSGDLGETAEYYRTEYVDMFVTHTEHPTVVAVYTTLLAVTAETGKGSQERKLHIYAGLIRTLDPLSVRYITRIILDTMRLGASDTTILDSLSWALQGDKSLRPAIEKIYQVHPDIGHILQIGMSEGMQGLVRIRMELHVPVIMMRAQRLSSGAEIIAELGPCALEPKYDGLRLQVHVDTRTQTVSIFTRGLERVTATYPDIAQAVLRACTVDYMIIEGEAIGVGQDGELLDFQHTVTRKRKHDVGARASAMPLRLFVFDILWHNGTDCTQHAWSTRRSLLETSLRPDVYCVVTPVAYVHDAQTIETTFERYTADGLEGIMAKKLDNIYQPGARAHAWVKLKRSYTGGVQDTIDCVVLGYDLGKGKRTSFGIGAILVGVYDHTQERYVTLAKIGTGLSDDQWRTVRSACESIRATERPACYIIDPSVVPDVWVLPRIVIEIRCDSISTSSVHTAGYSMRFPRLERFRDDKKPTDTTTVSELSDLAS